MQRIFGLAVIALGFALNIAQPRPALAWGAGGHQIVALIAQSGDRALYLKAVESCKPSYSRTGTITPNGMKAALELLSADPTMPTAKIDTAKTFDGRFVAKAAAGAGL